MLISADLNCTIARRHGESMLQQKKTGVLLLHVYHLFFLLVVVVVEVSIQLYPLVVMGLQLFAPSDRPPLPYASYVPFAPFNGGYGSPCCYGSPSGYGSPG